jgi:hypothetical protein
VVDCLRVCHAHGITLNGSVSEAAANSGSLACLRVAQELGDSWRWTCALVAAIRGAGLCLFLSKCPNYMMLQIVNARDARDLVEDVSNSALHWRLLPDVHNDYT